jgi:HlyD family secretion protein
MKRIFYLFIPFFVLSCGEEKTFDAQGTFDATEIVVSSEATGRILNFEVEEGASVSAGEMVGVIDTLPIFLQRKQLLAQQSALLKSRPDVEKQVASLKEQIATQNVELRRVENMLRDGAATP